MPLSEDTKRKLARIFYGEGIFMGSFDRFKRKVDDDDIPISELKNFYDNQTIVQVFKKRPVSLNLSIIRRPMIHKKPFQKIYVDTLFFTNKKRDKQKFALVNFVDGFSRYAYVFYVPLTKTDVTNTSINSTKAEEGLYSFLEHIKEEFGADNIESITTDDGSEFAGTFKALLDAKGIKQEYGLKGDVLKNPIVERFNYTLRLMIEKFRSVYEPPELDEKFIAKIVDKYNSLPSKSVGGISPLEAIDNQIHVKNHQMKRIEEVSRKFTKEGGFTPLPPDTPVRVALQKIGQAFSGLKQNWSTKVHNITRWDKRRNRYVIGDKYYLPEEIRKVDKDMLDEYDMFFKIVKNLDTFKKDVKMYSRALNPYQKKLKEIASSDDFNSLQEQAHKIKGFSKTKGSREFRAEFIIDRLFPDLIKYKE